MKQFFSLMAAAMISFGAFAQLPDGSIAPDFTATDINGVEHNLYSYLDSGYQVILTSPPRGVLAGTITPAVCSPI